MNVYIWTDSPIPLTKSIDVRGKTLSQIQAEGWSFIYGQSYTLDSNGISISAGNAWFSLNYPVPLSNAHKVTLNYTGNCTSPSSTSKYGGGAFLGINNNASDNFNGFLLGVYQSGGHSGGGGTNIRLGVNNVLSTSGGKNVGGDINETLVINLDTGVCSYSITSPVTFSTSVTLTSAQLAQVKQYGYITIHGEEWTSGYYIRLYTAKFTVE